MRPIFLSCLLATVLVLAACGEEGSSSTGDLDQVDGDASPIADAQVDEGDACWWCSDADPTSAPDTLEGTGTGGGKGEGGFTLIWSGTIDLAGLEGTYVTQMVGGDSKEEVTVLCEASQTIKGGTSRDDCDLCEFAYDLVIGPVETGADTDCASYAFNDETLSVGHGSAGVYGAKGGGLGPLGRGQLCGRRRLDL